MYTSKKWLTLLLAAAMCGGMLIGCSGEENPETEATSTETAPVTEGTETEPVIDTPAIPEGTDYNGQSFTTYVCKPYYMWAEEQTGEAVNDSVWDRQLQIEEKLNIDMVFYGIEDSANVITDLRSTVQAGDNQYQLMFTHMINSNALMVSDNLIQDWNGISTVNFDHDYWNPSFMESLSIGGKTPFAAGSAQLPDMIFLLYNKELATDYGLSSLYDMVDKGTWTLDVMMDSARAVSNDLNGDTVYDENDLYGFTGQVEWQMISFMYAADIKMTSSGAGGLPELTLYSDKTVDFIGQFYDFYNNDNTVFFGKDINAPRKLFMNGNSLFLFEYARYMEEFRDVSFDYGILPLPKYDESQKGYMNNSWSGLMVVPATVTGEAKELTGYVAELLSYYGKNEVVPAYFETMMNHKIARDEDSVRMLEIIYDNNHIVYDIGFNLTGFNSLLYSLPRMLLGNSADYASFYAKDEKAVKATLDDVIAGYEGFGN